MAKKQSGRGSMFYSNLVTGAGQVGKSSIPKITDAFDAIGDVSEVLLKAFQVRQEKKKKKEEELKKLKLTFQNKYNEIYEGGQVLGQDTYEQVNEIANSIVDESALAYQDGNNSEVALQNSKANLLNTTIKDVNDTLKQYATNASNGLVKTDAYSGSILAKKNFMINNDPKLEWNEDDNKYDVTWDYEEDGETIKLNINDFKNWTILEEDGVEKPVLDYSKKYLTNAQAGIMDKFDERVALTEIRDLILMTDKDKHISDSKLHQFLLSPLFKSNLNEHPDILGSEELFSSVKKDIDSFDSKDQAMIKVLSELDKEDLIENLTNPDATLYDKDISTHLVEEYLLNIGKQEFDKGAKIKEESSATGGYDDSIQVVGGGYYKKDLIKSTWKDVQNKVDVGNYKWDPNTNAWGYEDDDNNWISVSSGSNADYDFAKILFKMNTDQANKYFK